MVATQHANTLLQFRFNPEHKAERGQHGMGSQRTGYEGETIELKVPVGLVESSWGGTRIEPWTPPEAYEADPLFKSQATSKPVTIDTARAGTHFNAMVRPLVPFALRGVLSSLTFGVSTADPWIYCGADFAVECSTATSKRRTSIPLNAGSPCGRNTSRGRRPSAMGDWFVDKSRWAAGGNIMNGSTGWEHPLQQHPLGVQMIENRS
jgi:hypothetical protein